MSGHGFTLIRRIRAPMPRVWQAFTDPALLMQWFGPHRVQATAAEIDLRPGGRFSVELLENNGQTHRVGGEYREVMPETRLVFTWAWHSMPDRVSRVAVDFRPWSQGTEVTLRHDGFATAETMGNHTSGWTQSFERLQALFPEGDDA